MSKITEEPVQLLGTDKLNGLLVDIERIRTNKPVFVNREEYSDSYYEIYDMGLGMGAFVKLHIYCDSYGSGEQITGIEFVKGKEKKVITYEFE